jgi:hypothetical protein
MEWNANALRRVRVKDTEDFRLMPHSAYTNRVGEFPNEVL